MVKQSKSTRKRLETYLKCDWYYYKSTDFHIWRDFKRFFEVGNLAKCVHLQEVGEFHIIISVIKYQLFNTKQ